MIETNLENNESLSFTFNIIKEKMKKELIPPETQILFSDFSINYDADGRTSFTLHGYLDDRQPRNFLVPLSGFNLT